MAVDKALGEAVREAIATGSSWQAIGRALGVADDAETRQDVVIAMSKSKRAVWDRFWQ